MIRADSTLPMPAMAQSFHKASRPTAQRTRRLRLFGVEVEEGVGGRLGRSDPRTPGVKFEPGLTGTPHDAGRTRLGPSQYIGSQERRDSSTTVLITCLQGRRFASHRTRERLIEAVSTGR
jgi:hypothetical protein